MQYKNAGCNTVNDHGSWQSQKRKALASALKGGGGVTVGVAGGGVVSAIVMNPEKKDRITNQLFKNFYPTIYLFCTMIANSP